MLINVFGNTIDTEAIYKITPLRKKHIGGGHTLYYGFDIHFFNRKEYEVLVSADIYTDGLRYQTRENKSMITLQEAKTHEELALIIENDPHRKDIVKRLEILRNKIMEYWQANQTKIPCLDLLTDEERKFNDGN